jgi:hypothetical protein
MLIVDNGNRVTGPQLCSEDPLQERRQVARKIQSLGRAKLSPGIRKVLWLLRIYVLFMLAVVAINLVELMH